MEANYGASVLQGFGFGWKVVTRYSVLKGIEGLSMLQDIEYRTVVHTNNFIKGFDHKLYSILNRIEDFFISENLTTFWHIVKFEYSLSILYQSMFCGIN